MDVRTISVAKLLHSARKGRTEGEAGAGEFEDGEDGEAGSPGAREEDVTYGAGNVNATPRTIEVVSSNEANPVYKGALTVVAK
jgi:hypothetical protein